MSKRLVDWPDRAELTPAQLVALKECVRSEIDAIQARARQVGAMTPEAYAYLDNLADAQVVLGLWERGK